jgi:IS5 family transposase
MLKSNPQLTFGMLDDAQRPQKHTMLDKLNPLIDWHPVTRLLETMYAKNIGRPAIPPLIMFKIFLLEMWYGLSDVTVVEDIHDKRSFERFLGEDVRQYQIDSSSMVRFRDRMRDTKVEDRLLKLINNQIAAHGYMVRNATIIDATLVKAATNPTRTKQDGTPVDPDVQTTVRKGQPIDGMKVHLSVDAETEFIEDVHLTPITISDHEVFEELVPPDTHAVYADKAYGSAKHRTWLGEHHMVDRLMYKGARNHPITAEQQKCNGQWSKTRSGVERKIADLKNRCSLKRLRYIGLRRNWTQVIFSVIACNLKRFALIG